MKPTQASGSPSTDNLSPDQRSHAMRQVKSKNTKPELAARAAVRALGETGYRLHRADVAGRPDMVWIGRKLSIFINGCFWHGHSCAKGARNPKTRAEFWRLKIARTIARDTCNHRSLTEEGWRVLVLWECELRDSAALSSRLNDFFQRRRSKNE